MKFPLPKVSSSLLKYFLHLWQNPRHTHTHTHTNGQIGQNRIRFRKDLLAGCLTDPSNIALALHYHRLFVHFKFLPSYPSGSMALSSSCVCTI
jgi:hypothetical protein